MKLAVAVALVALGMGAGLVARVFAPTPGELAAVAREEAEAQFGSLHDIYFAQNSITGTHVPREYNQGRGFWAPFYNFHATYRGWENWRCSWVQGLVHASAVEGNTGLTYDMLIDFLAEEFEPDGSLRLWMNGNHPEVEAFMLWYDFWRTGSRPAGVDRPLPMAVVAELSDLYRDLLREVVEANPEFAGRGCPPARDRQVRLWDPFRTAWNVFEFLRPVELAELERWHAEPGSELDLLSVWRENPELLEMAEEFPC